MKTRVLFRATSKLSAALALAAVAASAIASQGCSATPGEGATRDESAIGGSRPNAVMRWRDPNAESATPRTAAAAGAHLTYYGGRVLANVKVYSVLWGSNTNATVKSGIGGFYSAITQSAYFDWLHEYNTNINGANGQPGTNQTIGRGSYAGQITITPSTSGSTIDDTQIQTELTNQINAGHLPAPDANTIYMIEFPPGLTITQGGSSSCVSGGFCAYHGTINYSTGHVAYGVMPDMSPGSGCDTGCGSDPSMFNNSTSVHSHELIEAVTDADVGLATANAPPLGWYDATNGEIGDICNASQAVVAGYTVQKEWSNSANACIATNGSTTTNDFSISLASGGVTIADGASSSDAVHTAIASGSAETVSFALSGAPSGVTGSFSPTSVSSGGSSTLTLNVGASVPAGTYNLTVTGTATTGSHTTPLALTVTSGGGGGGGALTNGNFETGNLTGWTSTGSTSISSTAHGGSHAAQVGGTAATNGDSAIAQTFTAPSGGGTLSFYYRVVCPDTVTYDWATATLKDNTTGTTATVLAKTCTNSGAWVQASAPVTGGHSYTLTLTSHDDNYAGDPTYTLYDDVTIGGAPPPPPPPPSGITNGGFESGISGWTSTGSAAAVTPGHSGTHAAQLGSGSPSTDSTLSQTFTAGAGSTKLSLWYGVTCPDTVTYDWATVTLKDNTTGTTTTILPKTCTAQSVWTSVSAAVVAGHSYTITLANHDDNYAGDPTYTVYDDVTLQ